MTDTTGSSSRTSSGQRADGGDLNDQIASLKADIASLSATVGDYLMSGAREGRATLERQADYYMSEAKALQEELEGQIGRNPLTAVLIALGLGFLIGVVSRR